MTDLTTILSWFETGDTPTQEQFEQTLSSFRHKDSKIHITEVDELESSLNNKLNISDLPDNIALVDEGKPKEVYNKEQFRAMAMLLSDYVKNGKIRADKIEALGLTDLIEATETTLTAFTANSNNYVFQQNDFIAIPDAAGNYTLYLFKGGELSNAENYLPTGLTSVTIGMVEGLQAALAGKLDKPNMNGSYYITKDGTTVSYKQINTSLQHLLFWDGTTFAESSVFQDTANSKVGVGTLTPTEALHIIGRLRASAIVLDENTEALPGQITRSESRFSGTNSSGIKRSFMYNDYEDYLALIDSLTDAQIDAIRTAGRKTGENYSVNNPTVVMISPNLIDQTSTRATSVDFIGTNLFVNSSNSILKLVRIRNAEGAAIPNEEYIIQNYSSTVTMPSLINVFRIWNDLPTGDYVINLLHNGLSNPSSPVLKLSNSVSDVDLNTITWEKASTNNNTVSVGSYGSVYLAQQIAGANIQYVDNILLSSEIIPADKDFTMEGNFKQNGVTNSPLILTFGLTTNSNVDLIDSTL